MKALLLLIFSWAIVSIGAYGQDSAKHHAKPNPAMKVMLVDVSCGMCQFGLEGNDCKLAVRIKSKAYYVEGADIDDFGDAHAADGFCNAVRKAKVQGSLQGSLFKVTWLQPIPTKMHKPKKAKARKSYP